jgi:hypothetical protein
MMDSAFSQYRNLEAVTCNSHIELRELEVLSNFELIYWLLIWNSSRVWELDGSDAVEVGRVIQCHDAFVSFFSALNTCVHLIPCHSQVS